MIKKYHSIFWRGSIKCNKKHIQLQIPDSMSVPTPAYQPQAHLSERWVCGIFWLMHGSALHFAAHEIKSIPVVHSPCIYWTVSLLLCCSCVHLTHAAEMCVCLCPHNQLIGFPIRGWHLVGMSTSGWSWNERINKSYGMKFDLCCLWLVENINYCCGFKCHLNHNCLNLKLW